MSVQTERLKKRIKLVFDDSVHLDDEDNTQRKSWLLIPENVANIADLIYLISKSFPLNKHNPNGIALHIEEFALLPTQTIDLIRDSDVITIKQKINAETKKRKRDSKSKVEVESDVDSDDEKEAKKKKAIKRKLKELSKSKKEEEKNLKKAKVEDEKLKRQKEKEKKKEEKRKKIEEKRKARKKKHEERQKKKQKKEGKEKKKKKEEESSSSSEEESESDSSSSSSSSSEEEEKEKKLKDKRKSTVIQSIVALASAVKPSNNNNNSKNPSDNNKTQPSNKNEPKKVNSNNNNNNNSNNSSKSSGSTNEVVTPKRSSSVVAPLIGHIRFDATNVAQSPKNSAPDTAVRPSPSSQINGNGYVRPVPTQSNWDVTGNVPQNGDILENGHEMNGDTDETPKRRRQRRRRSQSRQPIGMNDQLVNVSTILRTAPAVVGLTPITTVSASVANGNTKQPSLPIFRPVRHYPSFPQLQDDPRVGDHLAFKLLELNGWAPEVILKEGRVVSYDKRSDVVTIKIDEAFLPQKPEPVEGEEELEEEWEEPPDTIEIQKRELSDIRIIDRTA